MKHITPGLLMSQAVVHGGTAVLSGQVAIDDRDTDFAAQTEKVFERIDTILEQVGSDRTRLVSATIWLTDPADFAAFNELWLDWLGGAVPPARATVASALMLPGLKIEIQVTAACDG